MGEVRMSLQEAADLLGMKANGVRSRFLSNKIRGERDNSGKIWVYLDPESTARKLRKPKGSEGSKNRVPKSSIEQNNAPDFKALEGALETLREQLEAAKGEIAELRPKAEKAIQLEAENQGLKAQLEIRGEHLTELRQLLEKANQTNADLLRQWMESQPAKSFFARLFGR